MGFDGAMHRAPRAAALGRGAMCLGGEEDADVYRADVLALGKSPGSEESGHGGGAYNRGKRLPSASRRDLL